MANRLVKWWRDWRHKARVRRFYADFVRPGEWVFDVGAHIGSRTRTFLELGAQVVSVEPQNECARSLFVHFYKNPRFHLVNKALGAQDGRAELYNNKARNSCATLSRSWIERSAVRQGIWQESMWMEPSMVAVTTLDQLIAEFGRPCFAKIDVEGYEYPVIQGLSQCIPALSLEFHTLYLEPVWQSLDYLTRFGEMHLNYAVAEKFEWMLPEWVSLREMTTILQGIPINSPIRYGDVYVRFIEPSL